MDLTINNTQRNYYSKPLKTSNKLNSAISDSNADLSFKALKFKTTDTLNKVGKKGAIFAFFTALLTKIFAIKATKEENINPTEKIVHEENLTPGKKIAEEQKEIVEKAKEILEGYPHKAITCLYPNVWQDKNRVQHVLVYDPSERTLTLQEERGLDYARVKFSLDGNKLISVNDTIYNEEGNVVEDFEHTFNPKTGEILEDIMRKFPFKNYNPGVLYYDHNTKEILRYETPNTIETVNGSKHTVTDKETGEIILSFDADEINQLKTSSEETIRNLIKNIDGKISSGNYPEVVSAEIMLSSGVLYKVKSAIFDNTQKRIKEETLNRDLAGCDRTTYTLKDNPNTLLTVTITPPCSTYNGAPEPVMHYVGKINGKYVESPGFYEFTTEIDNKLVTFYLNAVCAINIQ